jgi:DUF917 family protein
MMMPAPGEQIDAHQESTAIRQAHSQVTSQLGRPLTKKLGGRRALNSCPNTGQDVQEMVESASWKAFSGLDA